MILTHCGHYRLSSPLCGAATLQRAKALALSLYWHITIVFQLLLWHFRDDARVRIVLKRTASPYFMQFPVRYLEKSASSVQCPLLRVPRRSKMRLTVYQLLETKYAEPLITCRQQHVPKPKDESR